MISLILCIIVIVLLLLYFKEKTINKNIKTINKEIEEKNQTLERKEQILIDKCNIRKKQLLDIEENLKQSEEITNNAFKRYCLLIDKNYEEKEKEYNNSIEILKNSYNSIQKEIISNIENKKAELEKIKNTKKAILEAQLNEEKIKNESEYYSIKIDEVDKNEIKILKSIEDKIREPRQIRMIIWTSYYSKPCNELANRVIKADNQIGIYKITNKINSLCYIGQSVDIKKRWREHMKCGIGIDTPANNKLYQAMKEYGLENFTFEVLEYCNKELLNEKEAFYIDLYDSYKYGYNGNIGIKKS